MSFPIFYTGGHSNVREFTIIVQKEPFYDCNRLGDIQQGRRAI